MTVHALTLFADVALVALSGAVVTFAFVRTIGEGMLFERWGAFVEDKYWLKPFGGCGYCTSFWITALMLVIYHICPMAWAAVFSLCLAMCVVDLVYYNDILP